MELHAEPMPAIPTSLRESETVECKAIYVEDIKKEVIAFANTRGGKLYIGVSDTGEILGVDADTVDETLQRISNAVRDAIQPDVTLFVRYRTCAVEEKLLIEVEVQQGTAKPYYLVGKGIRPEGVYVRQGTSSVPASAAAIRAMIKETDGDHFEEMRSLRQDLSFQYATSAFEKRGIAFGTPQQQTLGLMDSVGQYTNLGLLLSDQCPHIIKAATFAGEDQQNFQNRYEFTGSLLQQVDDAYRFLDMNNPKKASFSGLLRTDHPAYPETALREALLNAVVHRDYSSSAATLISLYSDRIEIVSFGGLVSGLALEDIYLGLSVCRNPKLANLFYRLQLIEAYGTGIRKMQSAYRNSPVQPQLYATNSAFKVLLPHMNPQTPPSPVGENPLQQAVLALLDTQNTVSRRELEAALRIDQSAASRLLRSMVDAGLLSAVGRGKNTTYRRA